MAPFDVKLDERDMILLARLSGFWDATIARRYVATLDFIAGQLASRAPQSRWLIDCSNYSVQGRETTEIIGVGVNRLLARYKPRVALLQTNVLMQMQSTRIIPDPAHRIFPNREEARAWLRGPA